MGQLTGVSFFIKKGIYLFLLYVCVYVLPPSRMCLVSPEPEEDTGTLGSGVTDGSDL